MKYLIIAVFVTLTGCTTVGKGGFLTGDPESNYVKKECFDGRANANISSMAAGVSANGDITIYGIIIKGDVSQETIDKIIALECPSG